MHTIDAPVPTRFSVQAACAVQRCIPMESGKYGYDGKLTRRDSFGAMEAEA